MVDVSVVIPSMNEAKTIGICVEKIKKVFKDYNIDGEIIVSDNSSDESPEIARKLGARVITPDRKGYGYAYIYAFKHVKGKYIIIGDADNTYDFLEMPKLLEPLMKDEADIVIGSRFKGEIRKGAMPWLHKYIGNPLLTHFLNIFYKAGISDAHSGFRALTREALEKMQLRADGMEFSSEMVIEAKMRGLRIKEIPIIYYPREINCSKLRSFKDGWRHIEFMLIHTPKYLYYVPGLIMLILGLSLLFVMNLTIVRIGNISLGIHSIVLSSLLAIFGYQLLFLGVFSGLYINFYRKWKISDRLTNFILKHASLTKGVIIGLIIFLSGLLYLLRFLFQWIRSGFIQLPLLSQDMLGFTLLIIGLQTMFNSFFLNMLIKLVHK